VTIQDAREKGHNALPNRKKEKGALGGGRKKGHKPCKGQTSSKRRKLKKRKKRSLYRRQKNRQEEGLAISQQTSTWTGEVVPRRSAGRKKDPFYLWGGEKKKEGARYKRGEEEQPVYQVWRGASQQALRGGLPVVVGIREREKQQQLRRCGNREEKKEKKKGKEERGAGVHGVKDPLYPAPGKEK